MGSLHLLVMSRLLLDNYNYNSQLVHPKFACPYHNMFSSYYESKSSAEKSARR